MIISICTNTLKLSWKKKESIIKGIQSKDQEIRDFIEKNFGEKWGVLEPIRQKIPPELTIIVFDSLKYIEENKKKLLEENALDSEFVRSFVHLNTSYYATTVFIIKEKKENDQAKLLFVKDVGDEIKVNKDIKPLGGRLPKNALPEKYLEKIIWENTGIVGNSYKYCTFLEQKSDYKGMIDKTTEVMRYPIAIQLESNIQRDGVPYHLDFIYLIKLKKSSDGGLKRNGNLDPDWYTFSEVQKAVDDERFYYESTKRLAELIMKNYNNKKIAVQD